MTNAVGAASVASMNAMCAGVAIASILLAGCADPYPSTAYFADLRNEQASFESGVLRFDIDTDWAAWQARNPDAIRGWRLVAYTGRCSGEARGSPLPYTMTRTPAEVVIRFGADASAECRIPATVETAKLWLEPVIPLRPLFDPGEPVGQSDVTIRLQTRID